MNEWSQQSENTDISGALKKASGPTVLSIEQLNKQIRQLIEGQLETVWVQGELSNFKAHSSGHFYFSLKDSKSQIKAVMFRGYNSKVKFKPTDGLEVIVKGRVTVYEPRGDYQISCEYMEPVGAGALQKAFEQLKEKLKNEGLFDVKRKRPLPILPRHVAIVTSPTGAAIQDMLNVLNRRNKGVQITLVPTVVQGETAAPQIVLALKKAWQLSNLDVIIIGRGGGSIEDLWAFNDETLARTIAQSPVPVISAVGHEIDFTIADFVADLRAPTPSAAAELVVKSSEELYQKIISFQRVIMLAIQKAIQSEKEKLKNFSTRLVDPKRKLQDFAQKNDELVLRLQVATKNYFASRKMELKILKQRIVSPEQVFLKINQQVQMLNMQLENIMDSHLEDLKSRVKSTMSMLDSLSPLKVVERGYSIVFQNEKVIKSSKQLNKEQSIKIVLSDSTVEASILKINQGETPWISKKN